MSYVPPPPPVYQPPYAAQSGVTYLYEPNQEERTFGTLSHALQTAGWWIAPLVIFLTKKRESRFVAFHSLQVLLLQLIILVLWVLAVTVWMVVIFSTIPQMQAGQAPPQPPTAIFMIFPVLWLLGMAMWIGVLLLTIFYSIKAGRGEWAKYPVLGGLAARMLHIDFTMRYQPPPTPQYPPYFPPQMPPAAPAP